MMKHGHPDGDLWLPAEADPTFNGRWFPAKGKMAPPRSLNNLMKIYYESVGRNANLLLNCSPGPDGLVAESHMKRYKEFGREIRRRFDNPVAETQGVGDTVELALKKPAAIDHVILMEDIAHGERVREYAIEGIVSGNKWEKLGDGLSVGHKRIQGFKPVEVARVRFRATKSVAAPIIRRLAAFSTGRAES